MVIWLQIKEMMSTALETLGGALLEALSYRVHLVTSHPQVTTVLVQIKTKDLPG